ncbi:MAG: ABC transporter ATP-binding protein [Dehalococcoidia bacterium]
MPSKISLRHVAVRRRRAEVLRVASLDVHEGEVLAVIGPNGAGKTTLLQVLALLERPARGEVLYDGLRVRGHELSLRRRMALMMQDPLLLRRSVAENVAVGLRMRGLRRGERKERVRRWLERFGVLPLADRSARKISGGEAHRVSLARAFSLEPEVLLLDEPFAALDQPTREALLDELAGALGETGLTTVFVTHDRNEALRLGDRVAVVIGGAVRQVGATADVFAAPVDEEVASLVGAETIVAGKCVSCRDGIATVRVGEHVIDAVARDGLPENVLFVLRPEDVTLMKPDVDVPESSARNHLRGRITRVTLLGYQARVSVDCGFPLVAIVTKRSLEEMRLAAGQEIAATFKAHAVHLIAKSTAGTDEKGSG